MLIQLLLSLFLLVSQQLALAHGYAHAQRTASEQLRGKDNGTTQTPATEHFCAQCLSAEQLECALGLPTYHFKVAKNGYLPLAESSPQRATVKPVRAFQPRAPPRA